MLHYPQHTCTRTSAITEEPSDVWRQLYFCTVIGKIDDRDECEWVNVSSGTGSPGLSRTKSKEP